MRRLRNAKIVATLGPASSTPDIIEALFEAGADVFRLNFSHGTHDDHRRRLEAIRAVERKRGRPIGVLLDLQGSRTVLTEGFGEAGQFIVISAGLPFMVAGTTNLLRIAQIQ